MPKKLARCTALLLAALVCATAHGKPSRTYTPATAEGAELRYVGEIPVAIFTGTPEQIGRQHAALLKEPGQAAIDFPKKFAHEFGLDVFWPFMAQAGRTLMLAAPERHQRELASIVKHSGMGDDRLAVANTLLELRRMGCSSMIVEPERSATGGTLFGRNLDFPTLGELHKYSLVLVYRPEGKHAFASIGFPGLVGTISGMNDAGLALATNDVEQSADGSRKFNPKGTPLACVFRRILEECETVDEAETLLKSEKATTWMNLAVCDSQGGAVFEITPDNIARRDDEQGVIRCTNHFRVKGMSVGETCPRFDALGECDAAAPIDVETIHDRLHAANQERLTLQTMIFEPRELVLHLALGEPPSSDDPLTRIELREFFAPSASSR
jgi:isopenicillin-N N-acyltransferase like protein